MKNKNVRLCIIALVLLCSLMLEPMDRDPEKDTTQAVFHSASILPYKVEAGEVSCFLGDEVCLFDERCFGDFGGEKDGKDKAPWDTALREFHEETRKALKDRSISKPSDEHCYSYTHKNKIHFMYMVETGHIDPQHISQLPVDGNTEKLSYLWVKMKDLLSLVESTKRYDVKPLHDGKYVRFNFFNLLKKLDNLQRLKQMAESFLKVAAVTSTLSEVAITPQGPIHDSDDDYIVIGEGNQSDSDEY